MCSTLGGWRGRVLNLEQPPNIPQRPMGSIPVVIRLVRPDGEEWWPGTANRERAPFAVGGANFGPAPSAPNPPGPLREWTRRGRSPTYLLT
jgi:hypothetical protein